MTRSRRALVLAALACGLWVSARPAMAGGWTQPEGEYYLKLWDRSLIGSRAYTADGETVDVGDFQDHQLNAYFEYGLRPELTLLAFGTPVGFASAERSRVYMGPLAVGARYGLLQAGALKLAVEAHYGFASGLGDTVLLEHTDPATDSTAVYRPARYNHYGELQLQAGHGFGFGYVSAAVGSRLNSYEGGRAALTASLQLGIDIVAGLSALVYGNVYQPFEAIEATNAAGVGPTRYLGVGLGLHYAITQSFGVQAAIDGGFAVESNAAAPSLQLGADLRD